MKVLVVGGGGREHALCWKIAQSPRVNEVFCVPGNAGTAQVAKNVELSADNFGALALWAVEEKIDLTVVGPEAPLARGIVDVFNDHGLRIFGPGKDAARLESSKSFAKSVMLRAGVKTAHAEVFEDFDAAKVYVERRGAPIVIKADGLAAGKGVTVARTSEEAIAALRECLLEERFSEAGGRVVVEEFIEGREASVIAMVDGTTVLPLVNSQDYKRLLDGDSGPNTGGMGAISPTPVLPDIEVERLIEEIFIPVLQELHAQGISYTGFLYAGVIVDSKGVARVLEFNCRLGDPETQVLLPRLKSDIVIALEAAVCGSLSTVELEWSQQVGVCVVAASSGYPEKPDDGKEISGLFFDRGDVFAFVAGCEKGGAGDSVVSKGGRVLSVTALGDSHEDARKKAYNAVEEISFDGMYYRKDIGLL